MDYEQEFLPAAGIPRAAHPLFQHLVETYVSETNKTAAVWSALRDDQLGFRPHSKSSTVREILTHQILSERRFFAEFMGFAGATGRHLAPGRGGGGDRLHRALRGTGRGPARRARLR